MSLGSGDSVQEPLKVVVRLSELLLVLVMLQGCATNGHGVRADGSFENYVTKLRELGVGARPAWTRTRVRSWWTILAHVPSSRHCAKYS